MSNFWGVNNVVVNMAKLTSQMVSGFSPSTVNSINLAYSSRISRISSIIEDVKWNVEEFRNHIFNDGSGASLPIALGQMIQSPIKKGCQQSQVMVTGDPIHKQLSIIKHYRWKHTCKYTYMSSNWKRLPHISEFSNKITQNKKNSDSFEVHKWFHSCSRCIVFAPSCFTRSHWKVIVYTPWIVFLIYTTQV